MYAPVLIFEINEDIRKLWETILHQQGIPNYAYLVTLGKGIVPPTEAYFRKKLELHRPLILITNWRNSGTVVRAAERIMTKPRPIEKWIVSGYPLSVLENHGAHVWADEILHKPIQPIDFATMVERRLKGFKV